MAALRPNFRKFDPRTPIGLSPNPKCLGAKFLSQRLLSLATTMMEYSHSESNEETASEFAPPESSGSSQLWFGGKFPDDTIATDAPLAGGAFLGDWPPMLWDPTLAPSHPSALPAPYHTIDYGATLPPWTLLDPYFCQPLSGSATSSQPTPAATSATSSASSAPDSPYIPIYPLSLQPSTFGNGYDADGPSSSDPDLDVPFDFSAFDPQCSLPGESTASVLGHFRFADDRSVDSAAVHPVDEASQGRSVYHQLPSLHSWSFVPSCYDNNSLLVPPVPSGSAGPSVIDLTCDSGDDGAQLHLAEQAALQAAKRMPPRTLELRVISAADITRLTAAERRAIYICSLETHATQLESMALGISAFPCNRDRIAQLQDVDSKAAKSTVIKMHSEIQKLRDRLIALRARKAVLRAGALSRETPFSAPLQAGEWTASSM